MSTQAAFNPRIDLPPVSELMDSFTESASSVLSNFETRNSQSKQAVPLAAVPQLVLVKPSAAPAFWIEPAATSSSRLGKGGALAVVVLVHVLAAIGLAGVREQVKTVDAKPLQVAIIAAPQSEESLPPPPKPVAQPVYTLPVEPVYLDIADPETTAITVAARPAETPNTPSVATGTPKTVSSVEYVREPQPKYPSAARALKQRGTVMLRVLVDINGRASEVNLHRTSGHRVLDDAARKAVLDAQFKPYMENGHALPVYVFVPIEFGAA